MMFSKITPSYMYANLKFACAHFESTEDALACFDISKEINEYPIKVLLHYNSDFTSSSSSSDANN